MSKPSRHLDNALQALPGRPLPTELEQYNEYLDHNELELAFSELEALGDVNRASDRFWDELIAAVEIMRVDEHENGAEKGCQITATSKPRPQSRCPDRRLVVQ